MIDEKIMWFLVAFILFIGARGMWDVNVANRQWKSQQNQILKDHQDCVLKSHNILGCQILDNEEEIGYLLKKDSLNQ